MSDYIDRAMLIEVVELKNRVRELEEDAQGYKNGQEQVQSILDTVMEANAKLAKENRRLREALGPIVETYLSEVVHDGGDWPDAYRLIASSDLFKLAQAAKKEEE